MGFLELLKGIFTNPHQTPSPQPDFNKIYDDPGLFTCEDDGFIFQFKNGPRKILWADIDKMIAYKRDLFTTDLICLDICLDEVMMTIHEETAGFYQFVIKTREVFPSIPKEWDTNIVLPPFAANETVIYDRSKVILKATV